MKYFSLAILVFLVSTKLFAQIPTDSLYFYLPFDGNFNDNIASVNGTNYGSTLNQDRHALDSSAIYLDGKNDWVDLGMKLRLRDIDDFTSSVWVLPSAISYAQPSGPKSGRYTIFGDAAGGAGFRFFQYEDELHFTVASAVGTDDCYHQINNYELGNWIHLVGVSNNGNLSIYANGNHVKTVSATGTSRKIGTYNMEIGRGTLNNNVYWEGRVDDIRIYNRVLTAKEIKALYKAEKLKEVVCRETIFDTSAVTIYDTTTVIAYDTIRTYETIYDSVTVTSYDTVTVEDTLNIYFSTGIVRHPEHEIIIYPNPAGSLVTIEVGSFNEIKDFNFSITNSLGQTVWSSLANASSFTISVSNFNGTGLFHFNIYNKDAQLIKRSALMVY